MAFLTVSGISKKEREQFSVNDISFSQEQFQKIAIAGETGSGKTTLLKLIAGLAQSDSGEIRFFNKKVLGPFEKLIPGHPGIAYLSQHFELRNNYRVEEELESKNLLSNDDAYAIYKICRIDHLLKRKTDQLSGGERQRIVLARLLTTSPKLLLLDEPFSNLDAGHKKIIQSVIQDIGEKLKITCMLVSHDAGDTLPWADTILVMKEGKIIQQGTPEEIYKKPVNEYCAALFGDYNLLDEAMITTMGIVPSSDKNGKKILIQPESASLNKNPNSSIQGTVEQILFWGSYYTADVVVAEQVIRVRTTDPAIKTGDIALLSISPADLWYL